MWAGVDVGGLRKGFHAAVADDERLVLGPVRFLSTTEAVEWILDSGATFVAVDSPRACAPDGLESRDCESQLAASVCRIRYTPDRSTVWSENPYYEWIRHGLGLYNALEGAGLETVECFPTASLTRWGGPRGTETRAVWSRRVLESLDLADVPARLSQDGRDAIAAALTARAYGHGGTQQFGEIVVPGPA